MGMGFLFGSDENIQRLIMTMEAIHSLNIPKTNELNNSVNFTVCQKTGFLIKKEHLSTFTPNITYYH